MDEVTNPNSMEVLEMESKEIKLDGQRSDRAFVNGQRSTKSFVLAGLFVALSAIAGLAVMKTTSAAAADGSGPAGSAAPSADVLRAAQAELEANVASGWVPMDEKHPYAGEPVQGWVPIGSDASSLLPAYQKVEGRLPVFAQKGGGRVLGYLYQYIGFVPVDLADGGTFDAHAVRSERVGCDPVLADGSIDAKCNSLFMESMGS